MLLPFDSSLVLLWRGACMSVRAVYTYCTACCAFLPNYLPLEILFSFFLPARGSSAANVSKLKLLPLANEKVSDGIRLK